LLELTRAQMNLLSDAISGDSNSLIENLA